jgi:predicted secreted acid phosphatase
LIPEQFAEYIYYILVNTLMDTLLYIATITSFFQVEISHKTLVVLDIDETILQFPGIHENWWHKKHKYYSDLIGGGAYDHKTVNSLVYNDWLSYVTEINPTHTDERGLFNLFERVKESNSHIIFLTARFKDTKELTYSHLKHLGISGIPVHFTSMEPKGDHLNRIIDDKYSHVKNIVFVDDMDHNLHSVGTIVIKNVKRFKFVDERIK